MQQQIQSMDTFSQAVFVQCLFACSQSKGSKRKRSRHHLNLESKPSRLFETRSCFQASLLPLLTTSENSSSSSKTEVLSLFEILF